MLIYDRQSNQYNYDCPKQSVCGYFPVKLIKDRGNNIAKQNIWDKPHMRKARQGLSIYQRINYL